jgi:cyclophilin family peptidyl-prolyl cis-trans isomerase
LDLEVKVINYLPSQRILRRTPLVAVVALMACASVAMAVTPTAKVRFYMNMGTVEIELYGTQSPLNVANFLAYVDNGSYSDSIIHRTRDGTTVASSDLFAQGGSFKEDGTQITPLATVKNEFNAANGLSNVPYTLAAAQTSAGIDSATSGWFINQTNNAAGFDSGKYTVMGKVTLGANIIDQLPFLNNLAILQGTALSSMPIYNNGEVLINRAIRIPVVAGDYNFSGSVTSADYTVWRNNLGSTTNLAADGNGNGVVDEADYVLYRKRLGASSGSGSGDLGNFSVPEPASCLLIFAGLLIFNLLPRRRACRARN